MIKMKRKKMNSQTKKRKKARKLVTRMKPTVNQTVYRVILFSFNLTWLLSFTSRCVNTSTIFYFVVSRIFGDWRLYPVDPLLYRCPSGFGPSTKLSENIILDVLVELIYVPVRTKVCFRFKTCNWRLEMTLRDSRTPLDSIGDKLLTPIYFVIVQCLSVGTTWYSASCARNGCTWAARDIRLPWRASGSALSADRPALDVFVIFKVLFRIPQRLISVEIRK